MEQQNQQPVQRKTEPKPPIKTNWKYIAIVVVLGLVVGGVWLLFQFTSSPAVKQTPLPSSKQVRIVQEDQICAVDTDCVVIETDCNSCSCGDAINKIHQQKYQSQYEMLCKNYSGGICDFYCRTPFPRCINNRCALSAEKSIGDFFSWQTYRNDRFRFEFRYPQAWKIQETSPSVLELKNPEDQIYISIRSFDASVRGISYCEAHPYDIPRCEQNIVDDFYGTIDWQISDSEANALFDDTSITLGVRPPTNIDSAIKAFFRTFLSTFRFVEQAD